MHSKGFAHLVLLTLLLVVGAVLVFIFYPEIDEQKEDSLFDNLEHNLVNDSNVMWEFDQEQGWYPVGDPPDCPDPLVFPSPVDVNLASGILYPGQIRGTDYKPHGGFRFDERTDNDIEVKAIMDGYILKAAKYNDGYDTQTSIFYINPCGIMILHDHLLTLSPKLEKALLGLPVGQNGDSRTTNITGVEIKKGETLATQVGYPSFPGGAGGKNIFVDFGLYDLRSTNGVDFSGQDYPSINEYGRFALCWLDYLEEPARSKVYTLPAGGVEGKKSDYCKPF